MSVTYAKGLFEKKKARSYAYSLGTRLPFTVQTESEKLNSNTWF